MPDAPPGAALPAVGSAAALPGAALPAVGSGAALPAVGSERAALVTDRRPARPLLAAKLSVAPLPEGILVSRARLWERLDEGVRGPLTLVRAPAGWGKTVLLASWYRSGRPILGGAAVPAWLTVEPGDHGPGFWSYLAAALGARPGGSGPSEMLVPNVQVTPGFAVDRGFLPGHPADRGFLPGHPDHPGSPPGRDHRDFLEELAADLAQRPEPVVLVLDDLDRAGALAGAAGGGSGSPCVSALAADLDFLSRHAGDRLRMVIAARTEPTLGLHRWRLSGDPTEIHAAELAFTDEELADLLAAHDVHLPADQAAVLRARTEGWPAGLRMAARRLRDHPDSSRFLAGFAGDDQEVAEYLTEEVLAGLPERDRDALLRTALVETVSGGLLDALTGRTDGSELLASVERDIGFLVPLGSRPAAYRCHPMLRDLLRAGLRQLPADQLTDLHRRAAAWFADHNRPVAAVRHALLAGDGERARQVLAERWADVVAFCPSRPERAAEAAAGVSGGVRAGVRAGVSGGISGGVSGLDGAQGRSSALPPPSGGLTAADAELALAYAAERLHAYDPEAAGDHLDRAASSGLRTPAGTWFDAALAGLRLAHAQLAGDEAEVRAALDRLPPTGDGLAAIAAAVRGAARLGDGDLGAAETELAAGAAAARRAGAARAELICASRLALAYALGGRLRAAESMAQTALATAADDGGYDPADSVHAQLARALVAWHRDLPDDALGSLTVAERHTVRTDDPAARVLAAVLRCHLLRDRGELAAAGQAIRDAQRLRDDIERSRGDARLLGGDARLLGGDARLLRGDARLLGGDARLLRGDARPQAREWPPDHWLLAAEADLRTGSGDASGAAELLRTAAGDRPEAPPLAVALARALLVGGDAHGAGQLLAEVAGPAADAWPLPARLEAGLLDAVAAREIGDHRGAARRLEEVLRLAGPEDFRRIFTRAQPSARGLLAAHLDSGTAYWPVVSGLVTSSEPLAAAQPTAPGGTTGPAALREPLTDRELTILRYLQSILSNVEIAAELSLSVNTVKTHVRNIYRKLDAGRRRDAIRRARELRLI